ncbi:hypothetical protein HDU96_010643 [Phlyctochytrium bullatum]|nr:hypothetical protein HDU96_010643 [Phlyctochytrium bullatum]
MGNRVAKARPPPAASVSQALKRQGNIDPITSFQAGNLEAGPKRSAEEGTGAKGFNQSRENERVISNFNALTWAVHTKEAPNIRQDNALLTAVNVRRKQEEASLVGKMTVGELCAILTERRTDPEQAAKIDATASPLLKSIFVHVTTPELVRQDDGTEKGYWVDDLRKLHSKSM